ncbi:hypothetical protein TNCV_1724111 [Trichonephila clavipes]|nr:hypothetical protein TNCV_1724111 [Trichonephila clavipes]
METFRRCKQACVDALMMMPDHHPDEPFYVRALTELQDIEETSGTGRVWTVNSPQSHIVRVYDAGRGNSGVFHHSSPGSCLSKSSIMEAPVDDQCINMEDLGPPSPPKFPDELR